MSRGHESIFGELEDIIETFEEARATGQTVHISDFLPDRHDPLFLDVLQELVRIELEYRFRSGTSVA